MPASSDSASTPARSDSGRALWAPIAVAGVVLALVVGAVWLFTDINVLLAVMGASLIFFLVTLWAGFRDHGPAAGVTNPDE